MRLLVPMSRQGGVFEFGNALARRDVRACEALLGQLFEQGESPVGLMLASVIPTVRNLLLMKDLMARHRVRPTAEAWKFGRVLEGLPPEATAHLPRKKDGGINAFPLGIAANNAARFEMAELRALFAACLEANVRLVTSSLEPRIVFMSLIARVAKA